ncbi:hypothetical protein ANO11243_029720 [Dothideomycetidae sp. 11243]|nr:hypothetical protein ANO11243_029720 [fungal sp. No.11243]
MSRSSRIFLGLLSITALLTFLASLGELILAGVVQHRLKASHDLNNNEYSGWLPTDSVLLLPPHIPDVAEKYLVAHFSAGELAIAVLSLLGSLLTIGLVIRVAIRASHAGRPLISTVRIYIGLFVTIVAVINLGVLGWVFGVSHSQGQLLVIPPPSPLPPGESNFAMVDFEWSDTITWETYLCSLATVLAAFEGSDFYSSTCHYSRASRWGLIPLCMISFLMAVVVWTVDTSTAQPVPDFDKTASHRGESVELPNSQEATGLRE